MLPATIKDKSIGIESLNTALNRNHWLRYTVVMLHLTLLKALINSGFGARRQAAEAIMRGAVRINGAVVTDLRFVVDTVCDRVTVDGRDISLKSLPTICLMMNKPPGVLCTASDERGRRTVYDLIPEKYRRFKLHAVGRLDKDSTGLILLTNDGALTYRLTHPRHQREKEYWVQIDGQLTENDIRLLEQCIELEDGPALPAVVHSIAGHQPYNYSIAIYEGRKRQVRRMFAAIGHRVLALKRVRVCGLWLGDLIEGEVRELSPDEVKLLT